MDEAGLLRIILYGWQGEGHAQTREKAEDDEEDGVERWSTFIRAEPQLELTFVEARRGDGKATTQAMNEWSP